MNAELSADLLARARIHAALGDPARLAIVDTLAVGDASPGELAHTLHLPTNLIAHHINVLHQAGIVERTRSEGDRRRTYLRLRPAALTTLAPMPLREPPRLVFVCTHNTARSQLAAALWTRHSQIPADSAGTEPGAQVHPRAVKVGRRHGLTIASGTHHVRDVVRPDDLVIAVCDLAHEHLPSQAGRPQLHWSVPDPAPADTDAAFETAYTDLANRVDRLAAAFTTRS
jgi:protein-tyrosine-phosphatase